MHHLCVHNWLDHLDASSEAGDPAIRAMAAVGIDITREFPRPSSDIVRVDGIEVMSGCGPSCPSNRTSRLIQVA